MRDVIQQYPQLWEGVVSQPFEYTPPQLKDILICGMGGSGISGDVVLDAFGDQLSLPLVIHKHPELPAFVNEHTLQLSTSYSGNTWETIDLVNQGLERGAQVVGVSSGGVLSNLSKEKGFPLVSVPADMQPRAAFPSLLPGELTVLGAAGILDPAQWAEIPSFLTSIMDAADQKGKELAEQAWGKNISIYSMHPSVALRVKTQVNENSKLLCNYAVFPDLNHNEVLGWEGATSGHHVILFRSEHEPEKLKGSIDFLKEMIAGKGDITEIWPEGKSRLEQILYSILIGDFMSYYLGIKHGVDVKANVAIDRLKAHIKETKG